MKILRILVPCALMIACGLVDLSHSHPTPNMEDRVIKSVARNVDGDGSEAKYVMVNIHSGLNQDPSSRLPEHVDLDQKSKVSKPGKSFKSLASSKEEKPLHLEETQEANHKTPELSSDELDKQSRQAMLQKAEADRDKHQKSVEKSTDLTSPLLADMDKDDLEFFQGYAKRLVKGMESLALKDPAFDLDGYKAKFSKDMKMTFGIDLL
ncbi:hypothetical protein DFH28DRAFT_235598 [Melampsora americana]|nr:hypothetical protein DFH28DRAFT_235598 [Melampsora americana]